MIQAAKVDATLELNGLPQADVKVILTSVEEGASQSLISDENGNVVALVPGEGPDDKEMLRNARRITHAPEMSENYYAAHGLNIK